MKPNENLGLFLRIKPSLSIPVFSTSLDRKAIDLQLPGDNTTRSFTFDTIFDEKSNERDLFMETSKPLLEHFLSGYNSTYFVYGQTGSGKTYTMGLLNKVSFESEGIVPMSLQYIFEKKKFENDCEFCISFLQIYMEEIRDLLNPEAKNLIILEDFENKDNHIKGLVMVPIKTLDQALQLINAGLSFRKMGSQKINQNSSRSHIVLILTLTQKIKNQQLDQEITIQSKISFVDLAGSERVKKTSSTGKRLDEAKYINSSLSALSSVISALRSSNLSHVPFRDNKLTRILQTCLNGDSKVVILSTICKPKEYAYETLSTLLFANRCRDLHFKPLIKIMPKKEHIIKIDDENLESEKKNNSPSKNSIKQVKQVDFISENQNIAEIMTYLLKLLKSLNKFVTGEIKKTEKIRTDFTDSINERILQIQTDLKYNIIWNQGYILDFINKEYEKLDLNYNFPMKKINETKIIIEDSLANKTNNELIDMIQDIAKIMITNIQTLGKSSSDLENLKTDYIIKDYISKKRDEELENWTNTICFLLKTLQTSHMEFLKVTQKEISEIEKEQQVLDYTNFLEERTIELLNPNSFYDDINFFKEKIRQKMKFDHTRIIKDQFFLETMKTLKNYSNSIVEFSDEKTDKKEKKDEKTNKTIGRFCDRELSFNLYNKSISNFFSENEDSGDCKKPISRTLDFSSLMNRKKSQRETDNEKPIKKKDKSKPSIILQRINSQDLKIEETLYLEKDEDENESQKEKENYSNEETSPKIQKNLENPDILTSPFNKSIIKDSIITNEKLNSLDLDHLETNKSESICYPSDKKQNSFVGILQREIQNLSKEESLAKSEVLSREHIKTIFEKKRTREDSLIIKVQKKNSSKGVSPEHNNNDKKSVFRKGFQEELEDEGRNKNNSEIVDVDSLNKFMDNYLKKP